MVEVVQQGPVLVGTFFTMCPGNAGDEEGGGERNSFLSLP